MAEPKKAPTRPEAVRLEQVRKHLRIKSVRDFWIRLGGKEGSGVGYGSAKSYHVDRIGPIQYYRAAAEVFSVSLEWLLTGKGFMTREAERRTLDQLWRKSKEGPGDFETRFFNSAYDLSDLSDDYLSIFESCFFRVVGSLPDQDEGRVDDDTLIGIAEVLRDLILEPINRLDPQGKMTHQDRPDYFLAMIQALRLAVPNHGENVSAQELLASLRGETEEPDTN